jgi:hypothetical protein
MVRLLALTSFLFLSWAPSVQAQKFEDVLRAPEMIEAFDGKTLVGWEIEGEHSIKDGVLVIGGKAAAKLRPAVLGEHFKLFAEFQHQGGATPRFHFHVQHSAPLAFNVWSPLSGNQWQELSLINQSSGSGRDHRLRYENRAQSSSMTGMAGGGSGVIDSMEIIIPAGTQLSIRKLRWFSPPPPPPPSKSGVWIAMGVLGVILGGAMILGWLLNRRRSKAVNAVP